jgi:hypothetical protein
LLRGGVIDFLITQKAESLIQKTRQVLVDLRSAGGPVRELNHVPFQAVTEFNLEIENGRRRKLINLDGNIVAGNDDVVRPDVFNGRRSHRLARSEVELGSMPGTDDALVGDHAFAEGSAIVRANVINRIDHTIHVEQPDRSAGNLNSKCAARRQFVGRSDPVNWHRRPINSTLEKS